jgi:uridine kinase
VDGPDGAGKSRFADELAREIEQTGRSVIRASIDGFHRPSKDRFARFGDSPEGYYRDSFDHVELRGSLLDRLGPGGDLTYVTQRFDHRSDSPIEQQWAEAESDAVLVFDGVFLLRPELQDAWELSIFLSCGWQEVLRRVIGRDSTWMGSPEEVEDRYRRRYIPGQELYFAEVVPQELADLVIDNSSFDRPRVLKGTAP